MNKENIVKEKNKILLNDENNYENEEISEIELEEKEEIKEEEEYYVDTINIVHKSLLSYAKDNYLNLCEYLQFEDIENFLEKSVL
jgi:hypothetical protein